LREMLSGALRGTYRAPLEPLLARGPDGGGNASKGARCAHALASWARGFRIAVASLLLRLFFGVRLRVFRCLYPFAGAAPRARDA